MPERLSVDTPIIQFFSKFIIIKKYFYSWRVIFKEIAEQLKEIDQSYGVGSSEKKKEEIKFDNFEDTEHERKRKQVKMEP
jgi:hypothetical protein